MTGTPLEAVTPKILLPVTLSERARREAFVVTGANPERRQVLRIDDLADVERPLRDRIIDLLDQVRVATDEDLSIGEPPPDGLVVTAYGALVRGASDWAVWEGSERSTELRNVFSAGDGRTLVLTEIMEAEHGDEAVDALLSGMPLVDELAEDATLTIETVVLAYERALELAGEFGETMLSSHVGSPGFLESVEVTDDFLFIEPPLGTGEDDLDPVGFVRRSDPEAFATASGICAGVLELSCQAQEEFAHDVCKTMRNLADHGYRRARLPDSEVVSLGILQRAAETAGRKEEQRQAAARTRERYESERAAWIASHGSQRVRLAAERGYKHDMLYREERLSAELPGFVAALPKRAEVREIINPSERALTLETDTIAKLAALGSTGTGVKLVFVRIDARDETDLDDGEYIQVTGYLGLHTVWRPVALLGDDEIPF